MMTVRIASSLRSFGAGVKHGWQWCAGSGTDATPYFRVFNPTAQGQRFDPDGRYIRWWVPELADADDPHPAGTSRLSGYPDPIVDRREERNEALRRYRVISGAG